MSLRLSWVFALFLLGNCCVSHGENTASATESTNRLRHDWQYIDYPQLKYEGTNFLSFSVAPYAEGRALRLNVETYSVGSPPMLKTGNISARLHRADGQVAGIEEKYRFLFEHPLGVSGGSSPDGGMNYSVAAMFPPGTNILAESWFEIRIGTECYWVELPYGFDQNPQDISLTTIAGGPPKFDPAMKSLSDHDHVVRWQTVQYDLGEIQNHWRLSLIQSNVFHGESEAVLYREDGKPWDLFSPRTALRILHSDGTISTGRCVQIRLPEDSMRRNDTFMLGGADDVTRSWDQIEIVVDDKSYRTVIPSSLYKYRHGHALDNTIH
jgi:hypothetical protein